MKKFLFLVMLAVLALTACVDDIVSDIPLADGKYTLTIEATKGGNESLTKALGLSGSTLNATWTQGDKVMVYKGDVKIGELTAYDLRNAGASAKLSGTLDAAPSVNDGLTLKYLSPAYATQDGTLSGNATSIDKVCDYATATVTVKSISGGDVTIKEKTASFTNQQAIVKFTLLDNTDGTTPVNATELTVSDGTNIYTVTPASATNELFVALPGFSDKTVTLNAIAGGVSYNYEKSGVTFANNNYYAINVNMATNGMLPGEFSINAGGGKVNFSKGNLQYRASTGTWRFAPNQYDMIGSDNAHISDSYTGWIDLLGWGTGDAPTKSSTNSGDYSTFTDWGVNAISNGGNTANMWSTLTKDEWVYLFNTRSTTSGVRYAKAKVNDISGVILLPDDWNTSYYALSSTNTNSANYTSNEISLSDWTSSLEPNGAVFLPAAGSRGGTSVGGVGLWGDYWSSTPYTSGSDDAYYLYLYTDALNPANRTGRAGGRAVRLVYEIPYFQGAGTEADPYLISSAADWNYLAVKVNSGTSYAEKFFRQTADIDVTTMVGNSSDSKPFSGTYDGDGNTLNLDLKTTTPHTAPFRLIVDATIKNVVTTGSVHSTDNHPSGLVGETDGTCTIQNCRVSADVGGAQHSGGIVGHCYHANISIIGCVYSGTLTPASGQWTGGIIGWGGDDGGHTISISDCLFAGSFISSTSSTKFHPIGILQNQNNTKYLSNTYYTLGAQNTNDDASFVKGLDYKGKFARSITAGTDVTVANAGAETIYDVSGITSYGTGILYGGVLYAGNGEAISLTLSHAAEPTGFTFGQYTVSGGGTLANPSTNSPTLTMSDANQTINVEWAFNTLTFNYTGAVQTFTVPTTGYYTLVCFGAQGGYGSSGLGGKGGLSQLTYSLTQGDVLYIYVGGQGGCIDSNSSHPEGGDGGWNGGGKGGTGVAWGGGNGNPYNGGGGGGGATHIATSAIGTITESTDFTDNHAGLLLIAGGGGGGLSWGASAGGAGGGAEGGNGHRGNDEWNITWNNGTLSCGRDGMTSSNGGGSCEGCGGGGAGYVGGNTWTVTYNASNQSYSGAGGSSWGETTNGKGYTTTTGGATEGGNGKAVITWYGSSYPDN